MISLPLQEIGLQTGGRMTDVEAFTGTGTYLVGAGKDLDRVQLN